MSSVNPIEAPLPGERVVALSPQDASAAATAWLRRPNLFPGRALTAPTLEGRQRWQAGRIAQRGQAFTPGVVRGLELSHLVEDSELRLLLEPGQGLSVTGEDVTLLQRLECPLHALPVALPRAWFPPGQQPGASNAVTLPVLPGEPGQRVIGASLAGCIADGNGQHLNPIGIVLLQPVTLERSDFDPTDPCDRCACGEGDDPATVEDWRRADGVRLVWYPWPLGWQPLPATALRRRNALAHAVFEAEARLKEGETLPWEPLGVPLALVGLDSGWGVAFSDRAAVVRQGGRAREARLQLAVPAPGAPVSDALPVPARRLAAHSRLPGLWQARIEQFAEQLAELGDPPPPASQLADPFLKLPPCGLLPKDVLDLKNLRCEFFPPLVTLDAVPVPLEQLDVAMREAAPLAPIDLAAAERVRLLVPVPQASWEPRLLMKEVIDPEFQQTLDRFLFARARELGARQGLRHKMALLRHAIDGSNPALPRWEEDPLALEPESLSPWGPPPAGGGHRSAVLAGLHQHFFDNAATPFVPQAGESLFAWVCLDPENPPRTLMLQWRVGGSWEHRAFWGQDLVGWGVPGSASRRAMGALPEAGGWVRLTVPAAAVGLAGQPVNGMAFTLFDGRAAFGMTGAQGSQSWRKWFCNRLPTGARLQGTERWELLSHNDLWAPFETYVGVAPSLLPLLPLPADEPLPLDSPLRLPSGGFNLLYQSGGGWRGHGITLEDNDPGPLRLKILDGNEGIAPKLLVSVYLDEANPPRSLAAVFTLSVYGDEMGYWDRGAFWGENRVAELLKLLPPSGLQEYQVQRAGALPPSSRWVQLEIPLPSQEAREGLAIYGLRFFAYGGELAFSDITYGRPTPPAGGNQTWTLTAEPVWPRRPKAGGLRTTHQVLLGSGIVLRGGEGVLTPTASARTGVVPAYAELMQDPAIRRLSGHEQSQLLLRGVAGFADFLRTRIDRVDDITDFGFAHMQVDMHRLRQLMLSTTDASRLSVSPAIAAIAKSDSAVVVQAQIKEYLSTLNLRAAPTALAGTADGIAAVAAPSPTAGTARAVALPASPLERLAPNSVTSAVRLAQQQPRTQLLRKPSAPEAIVYANPVVGLTTVRTTSIAERLKSPPSTEARDYALANRQRTVASLVELVRTLMAQDSGDLPSVFEGFTVYGLKGDPFLRDLNPPATQRPLAEFLSAPGLLNLLLQPPTPTGAEDEALLYAQTVSLSDNTIALLRQLEGRLTVYRDALGRCEAVLQALQGHWSDAAQRLQGVEERLAEARHDVGVARALIAEEQARLAAINARRARVLAEELRFLAFVRPREASHLLQAPWRGVDPALAEAPVPACLRTHPDVPDELTEMLKVLREAPSAWFVDVPALIDRLDRGELLLRTLQGAQRRGPLLAQRTPLVPAAGGRIGTALAQVLGRQAPLLAARAEALARIELPRLAGATWQGLRAQVRELVSLGDLIDGEHGRGEVARRAAEAFDRIAGVCSCLHAEFSAVLPSIRLDWAELMSQFDETPSLRDLSNLPRFSEISSIDRRQMQAYADWLFSRIDPRQPQAEVLVNDLVRVCLLLASHAPVGRIVAGRLARPVQGARPGLSIALAAQEPARLRVGMQALVYRGNAVVARAVVEDIGAAEVSARVLHVAAGHESLGTELRVHFDEAALVSASPTRSGGVFKRSLPKLS